MAREQTARKRPEDAFERETIPPDSPDEGEQPIAASGSFADLDPVPVTPRPREEAEEIALQSGRYATPPPRSLWSRLWVAAAVIVVLIILAAIFWR